jgi:vacuolar-type H+-ATPase subunit I/STV1
MYAYMYVCVCLYISLTLSPPPPRSLVPSASDGHEARVASLYSRLEPWESAAVAVPILADRLAALSDVHARAASVVATADGAAESVKRVEEQVAETEALLKEVRGVFEASTQTMLKSIAALEEKINKA